MGQHDPKKRVLGTTMFVERWTSAKPITEAVIRDVQVARGYPEGEFGIRDFVTWKAANGLYHAHWLRVQI